MGNLLKRDDLTQALKAAREAADANSVEILRSEQLSRFHRELLLRSHWLREVMKGWYMLTRPDVLPGDSSVWYANFWDFLSLYLAHRFGTEYCLSAESSLDIHTGVLTIPRQVVIIVKKGGGKPVDFLFDTSAYMYTDLKHLPKERENRQGLQVMPLGLALCKVTPSYFQARPRDAQIALNLIRDPGEITRVLLEYRLKRAAGRLVGAYRFIEDEGMASAVQKELKQEGLRMEEVNPFNENVSSLHISRTHSPYVARIKAIWEEGRDTILDTFLPSPGIPTDVESYISVIKAVYEYDAYNSLSIEGYRVSPELIHRVSNNEWDPDNNFQDLDSRNALAARGYLEAHRAVEQSVGKVLGGDSAGNVARSDLQQWYKSLFSPSVKVGILTSSQLVGYRHHPVYIRNSRHIPPSHNVVYDCMDTLFKCLEQEPEACVRAVMGHYLFVFIHPYMDGNGRLSRFLMNLMLASGGYPWTVIRVDRRRDYLHALGRIDMDQDFLAFTTLIVEEMQAGGIPYHEMP